MAGASDLATAVGGPVQLLSTNALGFWCRPAIRILWRKQYALLDDPPWQFAGASVPSAELKIACRQAMVRPFEDFL